MYLNIAEHILEVSGEGLGFIPGFSPFVNESYFSKRPLISIRLDGKLIDKESTLIYQFTIEEGSCQFFKNADSYSVWWRQPDGTVWLMEIQAHGEEYIAFTNMNEDTDSHIFSFSVWIAFGIAALHRNIVAVHASTVIHDGKSILFLGESGTGKSTQSTLWLQHIPNTELLNDDSPFLKVNENETPTVWGSPWSGKTPCYKDKHTPISAFIRLRQAPYNSIKRLRTLEAIGALQPSLPPIFASEPVLAGLMIECLSSILRQIPVYILDCLPNKDAVNLVYSTLKRDRRL